jgi:peptidoglycan/LPS O-acetylase OafA/YrhL
MAQHARGQNWVRYAHVDEGSKNALTWVFFLITHLGLEAVLLFFVLSGFLVGGKVLERTINGSFDLKAYAFDRISRIYLPLIPALVFTAILDCWICGQPFSTLSFVGNLLGLQGVWSVIPAFAGNNPLWTLAYEFWFYLLAGLLAVICVGGGRAKLAALIGTMVVFAVFTRLHASLLFCWCLGAFSYRLVGAKSLTLLSFLAGGMLTVFGAGLSEYISAHQFSFGSFLSSGYVASLIFSLGLALVLPYLVVRKPLSPKVVFFEKSGSRLATFSYTLYLTHDPVVTVWGKFRPEKFTNLGADTFFWFGAECASCVFVAWLLYLPFESKTPNARNWLRRYVPFPNFRD